MLAAYPEAAKITEPGEEKLPLHFACEKNAQPALFSSRAAFEPPEEGSKKTSVVAAAQGGGFVYGPEHHTSG